MKNRANVLLFLGVALVAWSLASLAPPVDAQRKTPAPPAQQAPPAPPAVRIYEGPPLSSNPQRPASGATGQVRQLMPLDQLRYGDFTLLSMDGQTVSIRDLLPPGQPALIQFWQTSCELSQAEIPHLNKVWQRYHRQGLPVIALTIDDPATRRDVSAFVRSQRMEYPVFFPSPSLYRFMTGGATGTPQTYLFSRDGRIAKRFIGWDSRNGAAQLERAILDLF